MTSIASAMPRAAILGGPAAISAPQGEANRWPLITEEDEAAVLDVLRSGELSIHPVVNELEADYRAWLGSKHAIAHNNGTSALHGAMHAVGIGPGDEVIVPSATWWASVMPIVHCGGVPVFAESERDSLGLDPASIEERITDRTKAIVVVHLFGMPSKMNEIMAIARRHDLKVIEDASHAHGANYHGSPIGTIGDVAVFSMQANKLCPSAEGGMLLTDDDGIAERVIRYGHYERLLGMTTSPNRRFAATGYGLKSRMSPLSAAVARVQLRHLKARNAVRNRNCIRVSRELLTLGLQPFLAPAGSERVYFEFLISCPEGTTGVPVEVFAKALQAEGALVGAPRYPLLHQQPMFTEGTWAEIARIPSPTKVYDPMDLPATIAGNATLLKLPTFPQAGDDLLDQYVQAFRKVLHHSAELPRDTA